jgi:3-methyladenine DNA glycosylase AlkC
MSDVPLEIVAALNRGEIETVNLMEWLAADMGHLASVVAEEASDLTLRKRLKAAGSAMAGAGVTGRLKLAGRAIAEATRCHSPDFSRLKAHRSDLVRQWACYAVNDSARGVSVEQRLEETRQFAADSNMSVRETAWMAFRPHLAANLDQVLPLLERLTLDPDDNIRRFAVEVTRPRSVWGAHIPQLKTNPERAEPLLDQVREDASRYVKLAVGNWLNDASKTRPDWVQALCRRWSSSENLHTRFMIKRGLRTLHSDGAGATTVAPMFEVATPQRHEEMELAS